jgi:hypothetical protein
MAALVLSALEQRRCAVRIHRGAEPPSFENARPWAQKFVDLATLSAIVYRDVADNVSPPTGWTSSPDPQDLVDDRKTSLYFEVWEKVLPDTVEVAVVFRGTHEWKDWWSNLRWVTRFIPIGWDQYNLTRREIVKVVARAKQRHGTVRIVTAGHSLGGGLARSRQECPIRGGGYFLRGFGGSDSRRSNTGGVGDCAPMLSGCDRWGCNSSST